MGSAYREDALLYSCLGNRKDCQSCEMTKEIATSFMQIGFTVACAKVKPLHEQNKTYIRKRWETFTALMKADGVDISLYSDDMQKTVENELKRILHISTL